MPYGAGIYRHAKATGLLERRRRNLRGVAERILERADAIHPTAEAILSAMRIYAHITEDGRWIEPPSAPLSITFIPSLLALPRRKIPRLKNPLRRAKPLLLNCPRPFPLLSRTLRAKF